MSAELDAVRDLIIRADDHPAVVVPGTGARLTYAELQRAIDDASHRMAALGIGPGARVALSLANGPESIVAFLAVVSCGAAAAPLNPALGAQELGQELDDLQVGRLLHDASLAEVAAQAVAGSPVLTDTVDFLPIHGAASGSTPGRADPSSIALLLHTSGTTSRPKTVPIRQRHLVSSSRAVAATYGLDASDVSLCVMPLFHVHGLVASVLATLATGGTIVLPPRFSASTFWEDVQQWGVTWYTAVPTIHAIALTKARQAAPTHRLRFVRSCSAPLPVTTWKDYEATINVTLVEAYGMTEAAHQMASNPLPPQERRPGTVGPATGVEIAILNDDWQSVATGHEGEVAVRGPSVVDGYLDNPDANAASFGHGWFRTGDVGRLSEDGYLTLVGRIKELINRGGEKISPYEVEGVLLTHPAVGEAAAYPVPDEKYGEAVGAVVVLCGDATPAEIVRHCQQAMAAFKVPTQLTVLPEIPKGPTGKVQRRHLASLVAR